MPAGRRRRGHAEARRDERGLSGDRLGHGGAAPRADQAAGGGRLEPVLHRLLRPRLLHVRRAICRCAATARAPGSAGPTIRRSRSCGRRGSTPRTSAAQKKIGAEIQLQAFENVPYYPLGHGADSDGVPPGHHRRAGGIPDLLERPPHLMPGYESTGDRDRNRASARARRFSFQPRPKGDATRERTEPPEFSIACGFRNIRLKAKPIAREWRLWLVGYP